MINSIGIALQGLSQATQKIVESANNIANPQEGAEIAEDLVNIKVAEVTYKANLFTLKTSEEMSDELLHIFDEKV